MEIQGKISLVRIDNRLVHGQVGITWVASLETNVLIVVDNEAATDKLQQILMEAVAKSANIRIRFFSTNDFVQALMNSSNTIKMFIVVKTVETVADLHKLGVPIDCVNFGNLHFEKGKIPITKKVYINRKDAEDIQYLLDHHVVCFAQDVPGSIRENITSLDHVVFKD